MLILEVFRATFPPPLPRPVTRKTCESVAPRISTRGHWILWILLASAPFYNSRRATTARIARRTLQRFQRANLQTIPPFLPSPSLPLSDRFIPANKSVEFEGSSKANGVVNTLCRVTFFFLFSIEILKYRETTRFQDILPSNFSPFSSMKIEWLQILTNY